VFVTRCTGKSAQIPLFVWLPDAVAAPTPISALIYAATTVTSGVYLICRLSSVFAVAPYSMAVVATVGTLTALMAASIALVQVDIKRILAYSTVSQLGFMFAALGCGAFAAGFFHVFTHVFFNACLFLGAGSVMYAVERAATSISAPWAVYVNTYLAPRCFFGELFSRRRRPTFQRLFFHASNPDCALSVHPYFWLRLGSALLFLCFWRRPRP